MEPIVVVVRGAPVGKGRARHRHVRTKSGKEFDMAYTPAKTRQYEAIVHGVAETAMAGRPPLQGPLHVAVLVRVAPPASWPAWKREAALAGAIVPDSKPDSDNIKKAVYDGMNGVVWVDDCQACDGVWRKVYHPSPAVIIRVTPLAAASSRITRRDQLPTIAEQTELVPEGSSC